jgi:type III secretion system needle length determinant
MTSQVDVAELKRAELAAVLTSLLGEGGESPAAASSSVAKPVEASPAEPAALGHAILQSLEQQSSQAPALPSTGVPSSAVMVDRIEQVSALMTQMADRVLVTDPLSGQTAEVRIKVADTLMPDTEVRVWRAPDGQLRVDFETASAFWARALNEASTQLTQRLNERFTTGESAQVTVQHHGEQPGDGRSRNRQSPWEPAPNPEDV